MEKLKERKATRREAQARVRETPREMLRFKETPEATPENTAEETAAEIADATPAETAEATTEVEKLKERKARCLMVARARVRETSWTQERRSMVPAWRALEGVALPTEFQRRTSRR